MFFFIQRSNRRRERVSALSANDSMETISDYIRPFTTFPWGGGQLPPLAMPVGAHDNDKVTY